MNITKIGKNKKLNSASMTKHKIDMNISTRLNSTPMTERKTEYNYALVNQTINICKSNKPQNSPQKV